MSIIDKMKFWEKKDPFDDDPFAKDPFAQRPIAQSASGDAQYPTGVPAFAHASALPQTPLPDMSSTAPPRPMPQPQNYPAMEPIHRVSAQPEQPREFEIINLKLDAIKNALESINMRLERLERSQQPEKPNKTWYR